MTESNLLGSLSAAKSEPLLSLNQGLGARTSTQATSQTESKKAFAKAYDNAMQQKRNDERRAEQRDQNKQLEKRRAEERQMSRPSEASAKSDRPEKSESDHKSKTQKDGSEQHASSGKSSVSEDKSKPEGAKQVENSDVSVAKSGQLAARLARSVEELISNSSDIEEQQPKINEEVEVVEPVEIHQAETTDKLEVAAVYLNTVETADLKKGAGKERTQGELSLRQSNSILSSQMDTDQSELGAELTEEEVGATLLDNGKQKSRTVLEGEQLLKVNQKQEIFSGKLNGDFEQLKSGNDSGKRFQEQLSTQIAKPTEQKVDVDRPILQSTRINTPFTKPEWGNAVNQRVFWLANQQVSSAKIIMEPPELGPIEIQLKLKHDHSQIHFFTHSAQVKEVLEEGLPRLKEMFEAQGMMLDDAEVFDQSQQGRDGYNSESQTNDHRHSDPDIDSEDHPIELTETVNISDTLVDYYI